MITNKGKEIIAKYLLGTAPAFASYIAVGCGPKPRPVSSQITGATSFGTTVNCDSVEGLWIGAAVYKVLSGTGVIPDNAIVTEILTPTDFKLSVEPTVALSGATLQVQTDDTKECLDFEMFRVPIISRGYVSENGTDKLIFTAELPTEERYEISEIGIFSAGLNVNAGSYDSKTILAFSESENWKYKSGSIEASPVPILGSLTPNAFNIISTYEDVIDTSADNPTFLNSTRAARYEGPRYLNRTILMRGNTSLITGTPGSFTVSPNPKYLQLSDQTFNFKKNSSADLLKIAFSLVNVNGDSVDIPSRVRVIARFSSSDETQYAQLESEVTNSSQLFSTNRYFIASSRFDELVYSPTFSWDSMTSVKIYVSVIETLGATAIEASAGNVTLTTTPHEFPVDATITNATVLGSTINYIAVNNFSPGDVVNISGITSSPVGEFNIANAVVTESTSTYFKVNSTTINPTTIYSSGGTAIVENKYIEFTHESVSYTGTHKITSVPSTTTLVYYVAGASLTSTPLSPEGLVNKSSPEYFVSLDAVRLDNISTVNPLYGLTGYSLVQNQDAVTVKKNPNTNNYIEFRVNIGAL